MDCFVAMTGKGHTQRGFGMRAGEGIFVMERRARRGNAGTSRQAVDASDAEKTDTADPVSLRI